ncbi:MAG: S41 family peptidase [Lachnospiraceae bacterium]|nr:S41 family peptidase [Lachnospiraceae bacterium]
MENENRNETKNKNKFWKGVLVGALVTAFAGLMIVGVAAGISVIGRSVIDSQVQQQGTVAESTGAAAENQKLDLLSLNKKLSTLQDIINRDFLFDEDMSKVEDGIYKGLMYGLDDPYSVYYTAEEYAQMSEETSGVYCGIGAMISQNIETGIMTAIRVFPGSPAEEAGMKKGDIFYKVDGQDVSQFDLDVLVQQHVRGEEGTYVDLTVLRDGEEVSLHVQRRMVENPTVEHQMMEDKTGYVLVTQFDVITGDQFQTAVEDLEKQGMERLVIDLRDNPGGVVDSCVQMAAYLLPEDPFDGMLLSTASKHGQEDKYYCEDGELRHETAEGKRLEKRYPKTDDHELDMPIAVLLNGQSASASEVFAGALQDYKKAVLVGTTSFGKGIVQNLIPLTDGSAVKLTVAHYYTPAGNDLHKKGLTPDVEVEYEVPENPGQDMAEILKQDNQVQAAIEAIK